MNAALSASELHARVAGSSFYAGMRILPKAEREAMYAIYGFCRLVDDIADDQGAESTTRARQLQQWRTDINALYAGGDPAQAAFLVEPIRRFELERADFIAVIDGMQMDVDRDIRWPAFSELDLYCDRVASAVGRLSVRVFGMERAAGLALAHHLGRALQLTNILRDIDEDAAIGRVYLPSEALTLAGIVPTVPEELALDPRLDVAARWVAERAEGHFAEASALLKARTPGHLLAPRLMYEAYSRLLRKMTEQGWAPPRQRVRVSKRALLWSVVRLSLLP